MSDNASVHAPGTATDPETTCGASGGGLAAPAGYLPRAGATRPRLVRHVPADSQGPAPATSPEDGDGTAGRGYNRAVGARLGRARQRRRLTVSEVEARLDGRLPAAVISSYEAGEVPIPVEAAAALAAVYGVSLGEMLTTVC